MNNSLSSQILFITPLVFFISILSYSIAKPPVMQFLFVNTSYYLMAILFVLWAASVVKLYRFHGKAIIEYLSKRKWDIILIFILTAFIISSVPSFYQVLNDETNLAAISKSMVFHKKADFVTEGYWYFENFHPVHGAIPKRTLLLPFVTHIAHLLLGYRAGNVFVVNAAFLFILLFMTYIVISRISNRIWGLAASLLVASQPLVSQAGNSGGMEMINAIFLFISFICLIYFMRYPSANALACLSLNLLMLINTRYEAIINVILIVGGLIVFKYIKKSYLEKYKYLYSSIPILCLPIIWQRILKFGDYDMQADQITNAFGFNHLISNHINLLKNLFQYKNNLPYAKAIFIIGIIGVAVFFYYFVKNYQSMEKAKKQFILICSINLIALWIIVLSYFFGNFAHPSSSRLFLIPSIVLTLASIHLLIHIPFIKRYRQIIPAIAVCSFLFYHPVAMEGRFVKAQILVREYFHVLRFLEREPDKNFLVIYERPGLLTIHNYGAISFHRARRKPKEFMDKWKSNLIRDIYLIQHVNRMTGQVKPVENLGMPYRYQVIVELQNTGNEHIRISRLVKNN